MRNTNGSGYVYVKNWDGKDGFQHYHDRWPSWIKLHLSLLGNDAWLELSADDRCLLVTIWMLAGRYGSGRVKADQKWLCAQANIGWSPRSRNLERLIQAGFIKVMSRPAIEPVYPKRTREGSKEPKERERARAASQPPAAAAARVEEEPERDTELNRAGLHEFGKVVGRIR